MAKEPEIINIDAASSSFETAIDYIRSMIVQGEKPFKKYRCSISDKNNGTTKVLSFDRRHLAVIKNVSFQ